MANQNDIIEPFVTHTATAIIRRDSDPAWDSAVDKFLPPSPSARYVHWFISPNCSLQTNNIVLHHAHANSVVASTNRFRKFVNVLTKESKKPELSTFRWGQGSTISDVQREANAALEAYEERGNNLRKHFFRTTGRNFSNNASSVEVLLEFLPAGEFTSILCGALTLVFRVRGQSPFSTASAEADSTLL